MQTVFVLGNDHTNTLGVVQCLGRDGFSPIAYVWGTKTSLVKSSRYAAAVYSGHNCQACVDLILKNFDNTTVIPIIATCDAAALCLNENKEKLKEYFVFEYSIGPFEFETLFHKEIQVKLAEEAGFKVPKSILLQSVEAIPKSIQYPCLIKPLISCEGAKSDIRICKCPDELTQNLHSLQYTSKVIIQQYINHDFELSILGCGLSNGEVLIPCVEKKLTLYPKNVGLECLSDMQPLDDIEIIASIKNLVSRIGYVGVFSVEMMHNADDGKLYFTEINLRNDGANSFVYKYGVNLLAAHVNDLLGFSFSISREINPGYYIWEMHHWQSLIHREISLKQWIQEINKSQGFLTYFKEDTKPFYKQFLNWLLSKLHLKKQESY